MKYELTKPCDNCPFRTDIAPYLRPGRVREITRAIVQEGGTFACHKTTELVTDPETGDEDLEHGPDSQHCAGALILLEKSGGVEQNQMLRIAMRLSLFDPSDLQLDQPVYESPEAMLRACRKAKRPTAKRRPVTPADHQEDGHTVVCGACERLYTGKLLCAWCRKHRKNFRGQEWRCVECSREKAR